MDKIALASNLERKKIFLEVARKTNFQDVIIEKDFWVSYVLSKIFADDDLKHILCFKGGTSLSKAFGVIERFSEDIDLILHMDAVLRQGETLNQESNTKQAKFNEELNERAGQFIRTKLKDMITAILPKSCEVRTSDDDFHILYIDFPKIFDSSYIQSPIKLEIGPLALWSPNDLYKIRSFVDDNLPTLGLEKPEIPTIKPERTFWEKATILHLEHNRKKDIHKPIAPRYARHYYDLFKLGQTEIKGKALSNLDLLKEVVDFKKRFYPTGWAKYDEAIPPTFCLMPAAHSMDILKDDYKNMRQMIYGHYPSWDEIMAYIQNLENEINNL